MLFDGKYNYELISKEAYALKLFNVRNIGGRIKRRIITFYDVNGEVVFSRRSVNRTVFSKDIDLKDAKVLVKYYLEETEGDKSFDTKYINPRYFNVLNLGCYLSYEGVNDVSTIKNDNEEVKKLIENYDKNYKIDKKIDDDDFINGVIKI